jgi:nitrogen regulatory protein P-II 1
MKEIKAFVRRSKVDDVVHGLKSLGVKGMSISSVDGVGALQDPAESHLSVDYVTSYSKIYKIELVCREADVEQVVQLIQKKAHTGEPGDGVIFISNIERAVKIRSGEEGHFALDKVAVSGE